jgi:hypothetical protein
MVARLEKDERWLRVLGTERRPPVDPDGLELGGEAGVVHGDEVRA